MERPNFEHFLQYHLKFRDLQLLVTVADHANILKAADHLNMSQPAVSRSITRIENLIEVKLFDRNSQGTYPTAYGEVFVIHARRVLAQLRLAGNELSGMAKAESGKLVIGCRLSAYAGPLSPTIARMENERPGIQISIVEGLYSQLEFALKNGEIDIIVGRIEGSEFSPEIEKEILYYERWKVYCRQNHPLLKRRNLTLEKIVQEPWIVPLPTTVIRPMVSSIFTSENLEFPRNTIECSSTLIGKEILIQTDRLMMLPESLSRLQKIGDSIVILPVNFEHKPQSVGCIYLKSRRASPPEMLFREWLKQSTREMELKLTLDE